MKSSEKFKIADLVKTTERHQWATYEGQDVGIVVDTNINAWNEEVIPSAVVVMRSDGTTEIVYDDEIELFPRLETQNLY